MNNKIALLLIGILMIVSFTGCVIEIHEQDGIISEDIMEYKENVELDKDITDADIHLSMAAADSVITKSDSMFLEGSFKYNSDFFKPTIIVNGGDIEVENKKTEFTITRPYNKWDIKLTDKIPMKLNIDADASQAELNLTNLKIKGLDLDFDAASAKLTCDSANEYRIDDIVLNADASNFSFYGIGNLKYNTMDVQANVSRLTLDLSGDYTEDARVNLRVDASTIKLMLPDNVGVKIVISSADISPIKVNKSDIVKNSNSEYISKDYDTYNNKLTIYVNMNVTSLTID